MSYLIRNYLIIFLVKFKNLYLTCFLMIGLLKDDQKFVENKNQNPVKIK